MMKDWAEMVARAAAAAPPSTDEQRAHLAVLLPPIAATPPLPPPSGYPRSAVIAEPPRPAAQPQPVPHALYRWYDEAGELLYIGITNDATTRAKAHLDRSSWTEFAVRCDDGERHESREEAEAAEREAIKRERPIFNVQHASSDANARMVQYLLEHGRTDLLVAKIKRG